MDTLLFSILPVLHGGLGNLAAYLAAHVLLCLLPAFFIAGAMAALIPKETVTRFLGRNSSKVVSYPAAAAAGSLLAVCSCTIVPLFAGIHKKGAGLGPAITFLFFAPAPEVVEDGVARYLEQPGAGLAHGAKCLALPAGFQEEVVKQIVGLVPIGQAVAQVAPQLGLVGRPGGEQTRYGHDHLSKGGAGGSGLILRRPSRRRPPSHGGRHRPAGRGRPG